ncbi:GMC oxidoreductase [Catenovulum sp. 2E275]|uniref:GMC oxidoreductase n=1 Tax=Catenovulum sp. 2E275 TaxID=2980497 RepID=UPI0021D2553B|nr:GMC oxidoreductase [Catenovulum sp. 2E275]MCU4675541.1 GMC oxidoreductase [Catenovulum sp. 2E275]
MIIDGNTIDSNIHDEADICIIGGGVAGIVLARELKDSYAKIIMVEGGDEYYSQDSQDLYQSNKTTHFPNTHYSRLRFLGGSSNHWENNTSPFTALDFEKREWIPNSGWPLSLDDIEPFYMQAATYCGTEPDGYNTNYWKSKYQQEDLFAASGKVQTQIAKSSLPPVRFFAQYGEELKQTENILIYKNSNLVDMNYESGKRKITSIIAQSYTGKKLTINAKVFIMCLGGLENARMLLHFNDKYDNGLGNQGGNVGAYLMEHPTVRAVYMFKQEKKNFDFYQAHYEQSRVIKGFLSLTEQALRQEKSVNLRIPLMNASEFELSAGISSAHILADELSQVSMPDDFGTHVMNVLSDLDMVIEGLARKHFDKRIFESANDNIGFLPAMMTEQTPIRENCIKLSEKKDGFGLRLMDIEYQITQDDRNRIWKSLNVLAKEFGALGLGRVKLNPEFSSRIWGSQLGFSNHHMGTTKMAETEKDGVVDKNSLVFGTSNLFMAGSSVFCTGSHVPPTLTICAMSIRLAEYIKTEFNHA